PEARHQGRLEAGREAVLRREGGPLGLPELAARGSGSPCPDRSAETPAQDRGGEGGGGVHLGDGEGGTAAGGRLPGGRAAGPAGAGRGARWPSMTPPRGRCTASWLSSPPGPRGPCWAPSSATPRPWTRSPTESG